VRSAAARLGDRGPARLVQRDQPVRERRQPRRAIAASKAAGFARTVRMSCMGYSAAFRFRSIQDATQIEIS
jgi:hypothetical protein